MGLDATEKTKSGENFLTTLKTSKIDLSSNKGLVLPLLIDQLKTSNPFEEINSSWTVFFVNKPTLYPSFIACWARFSLWERKYQSSVTTNRILLVFFELKIPLVVF